MATPARTDLLEILDKSVDDVIERLRRNKNLTSMTQESALRNAFGFSPLHNFIHSHGNNEQCLAVGLCSLMGYNEKNPCGNCTLCLTEEEELSNREPIGAMPRPGVSFTVATHNLPFSGKSQVSQDTQFSQLDNGESTLTTASGSPQFDYGSMLTNATPIQILTRKSQLQMDQLIQLKRMAAPFFGQLDKSCLICKKIDCDGVNIQVPGKFPVYCNAVKYRCFVCGEKQTPKHTAKVCSIWTPTKGFVISLCRRRLMFSVAPLD